MSLPPTSDSKSGTSENGTSASPDELGAVANRRAFLRQVGALGASAAVNLFDSTAMAADSGHRTSNHRIKACTLSPRQTEGPFYLNLDRMRRDIRDGKVGLPLNLQLTVVEGGTCEPLSGVVVDVWHCDAEGVYSGYDSSRPLRWGHMEPDNGALFLRGLQVTDGGGRVSFQTIYPGCYTQRTTHVHVKVYLNERELITTQLYFSDSVTDQVYRDPRYRGQRDTTNDSDFILRKTRNPERAMMDLSRDGDGYLGAITIGVDRV